MNGWSAWPLFLWSQNWFFEDMCCKLNKHAKCFKKSWMSNATWQIMQNSKSYSCNNDKMNVNFLCIHSFHKVIFTCISVCDIAYANILVENIWIFAPKIATRIFAVKITQFLLSHLNFRAKNCFFHAHKFKLIRMDS